MIWGFKVKGTWFEQKGFGSNVGNFGAKVQRISEVAVIPRLNV